MKIYTDGGSRGNPGKAACAFVAIEDGKIVSEKVKFLGKKTNNEAEYNAVIMALSEIKDKELEIVSDSQVVIRQLTGEYRINLPHLKELYEKVQVLCEGRKVKFSNVARENKFISRADELVNEELDRN